MKREEYETELKALYAKAVEVGDLVLALDILERGRVVGIEDMCNNNKDS